MIPPTVPLSQDLASRLPAASSDGLCLVPVCHSASVSSSATLRLDLSSSEDSFRRRSVNLERCLWRNLDPQRGFSSLQLLLILSENSGYT